MNKNLEHFQIVIFIQVNNKIFILLQIHLFDFDFLTLCIQKKYNNQLNIEITLNLIKLPFIIFNKELLISDKTSFYFCKNFICLIIKLMKNKIKITLENYFFFVVNFYKFFLSYHMKFFFNEEVNFRKIFLSRNFKIIKIYVFIKISLFFLNNF